MCKLCGGIKDKLKNQHSNDNWEKKECPKCHEDVWVYKGGNKEVKARQLFETGYIENTKGEGIFIGV